MQSGTQSSDLPTLVTVTYNTWESFTSRLISSVFHYVDPKDIAEWIVVDNNSDDGPRLTQIMSVVPLVWGKKFTVIHSDKNIADLPQYNRIIPQFVKTEKVICISTDVRIFKPTIFILTELLRYYDMVGPPGPGPFPKVFADPDIGKEWHWIPKLLVDRDLDFKSTAHAQTHCFSIRRSAFLDVGGFWEPESGPSLEKGDLIAAELYMGTQIRRAGRKLGLAMIPCYHYGNQMGSYEEIDRFDRHRGWAADFPRYM